MVLISCEFSPGKQVFLQLLSVYQYDLYKYHRIVFDIKQFTATSFSWEERILVYFVSLTFHKMLKILHQLLKDLNHVFAYDPVEANRIRLDKRKDFLFGCNLNDIKSKLGNLISFQVFLLK